MQFAVTTRIDTSGLNRGLAAARQYSKRTVPELVNTSAYWVAVNTKNHMPFVTPERVVSELAVIETPVIGKRGKPLKRKKQYAAPASKDVPFAALLVAARANPNSRYNLLTNQRYALGKNPFKGVSREAGRAAMRKLIDQMTKLRRRSTHFLMAGWVPIVQKMRAYAVQKFMRGVSANEGTGSYYGKALGGAQPAREGLECYAIISNDVGMEGANAMSFNRALINKGTPILQAAIDREGTQQMNYALKHMEKELADEVNKFWK